MPAIGIDLGTTHSCVGVWRDGKVEIIANANGNCMMPSQVAFTNTKRLIGDAAKNQLALNLENTIFDAKRLIGRKYDDIKVQKDIKNWPFRVDNVNGKPTYCVKFKGEDKWFSPEEISSMVLRKMKQTAEAFLDSSVSDAVITVPAYFNDSQRQATKDAGTIAGLNVIRIISEPTAAALAYGFNKDLKGKRNVLIFDLGGGTFDVSVLTITEGSLFEVRSTAGDTHLGGEDFDNRLVEYFVEEFQKKYNKDVRQNPRALRRLRADAERVKCALSIYEEATLDVRDLIEGIDFRASLTRAKLEELCEDLFKLIIMAMDRAVMDANLDKEAIHDILMVGGSSKIPKIQTMLKEYFNGRDLNRSINPNHAVAYGAAAQAAILSGEICEMSERESKLKDILLFDVTPHSLGIETSDGMMSKLIDKHTRIPCKHTRTFSTSKTNQSDVKVHIFEGECPMARDNHFLGTLHLSNIPPAPMGRPQIEVTFDIDANCILNATVEELGTDNSKQIRVKAEKGRLTQDEIEHMLYEAEEHIREEKELREKVAARSNLESYVFSVKQIVDNASDKQLDDKDRRMIREQCDKTIRWLDENDLTESEVYETRQKNLMEICSPIMQKFGYGTERCGHEYGSFGTQRCGPRFEETN